MRKWFILFIISILPYAAFADAVQIGSLWYNLDESTMTAEVTSSGGDSYSGDIVIPGSVTYGDVTYSVKSIGVRAFNDIALNSVTIEDGIEIIKEYAFWDSDGINELVLPSTLKIIGDEAFTWAYITSLVLPEGLDSIGRNAFSSCSRIKNLEIPSTLTRIGDNAFSSCGNVSSVVSRIQTPFAISESVFSSCTSATLYVPAGTMTLYQRTAGWNKFNQIYEGEPKETTYEGLKYIYFEGSNNAIVVGRDDSEMRKITIPSTLPLENVNYNVVSVAKNAFQSLDIDTLIISSGVETIDRDAFNYCYNLKTVELPSTLKTIGDNAFHNCDAIKKIELPSSLDSIGNMAFYNCDNLAIVVSRIQNPLVISQSVFAIESNGYYDTSGNWVYTYTPSSATLYVPNGTKSSYDATEGWKGMFAEIIEGEPKEITYDGLNYIYVEGNSIATVVGMSDTEKRKVIIPSTLPVGNVNYSVKSIGAGAFQSRTNIDTLIIQSGIEIIGKNAFWYCHNLKSITIPEGVKTIGENAFREAGTWDRGFKTITLPASLDSIGDYAFFYCNNLSSVVSKIQSPFTISENVFASSWETTQNGVTTWPKSSATLYVPNDSKASYETTKGWNMFADIIEGELKEITYQGLNYSYIEGKGIATVIGRADSELVDVTIPSTLPVGDTNYAVKTIGAGAFYDISLNSVTIEDGIETIEKEAFWDSDGINKLVLPSTLKVIGDRAFTYAYITSLVLPEGLDSIGNSAFSSCYRIKKLELPSTLARIGESAFYNCPDITSVISRIRTPFAISENVFSSCTSATLYVPVGTGSSYQGTTGWNKFAEIIEGEPKEITYEGLIYNYFENRGTAKVIGRADEDLINISIPEVIPVDGTNYSVNEVGAGAFTNLGIETLIVSSGIETIGKSAFASCWRLNSVELPTSLRTIGDEAFYNASGFNQLIIPQGVDSIGRRVFAYCHGVQKIEIPSSLTRIGEYAFAFNENLASVTSRIQTPFSISQSVFCLESNSKWDSEQQKDIYTYTKSNANLYVPEGTSVQYQQFAGWNMFAAIYEGEIKEYESDSLKYAYLMSNQTATVIASDKYRSYSSITIPGTVTIDGVDYRVTEIGANAFYNCNNLNNVTIKDGVETIGNYAFQDCYNADFGQLPSSLRAIGDYAFRWCNKFNGILPEGLLTIGKWAFGSCYYMQKVVLPSTLTSIDEYAFRDNSNLATVISHISSPFAINNNVFGSESTWNEETQQYDYTCAADLYVPEGTIDLYKSTEGWTVFSNIYEGELKEVTYLDLVYTYNTSSKVATVVKGENYNELKIVSIPSTIPVEGSEYPVKAIAGRAFSSTPITSVEIADGLETIGQEAFSNCEQLSRISLPSTLVTIESSAFNNCRRLAGITIPASVKTIGNNALSGCYNLETIEVADGNEAYESLGSNVIIERKTKTLLLGCKNSTIPDGVEAIGALAFNNCQIEKIQFPETVKSIGDNAFASCRYLTEVILPEGLDSIAYSAFRDCELLETIEFPTTMKYFGEEAFYNCHNLMNVVSNIEDPKEISESVFGYSYSGVYNQATLWVPKGKIDSYKRVNAWNLFNSYDELLHDILTKPTITYDGHYLVMTNNPDQRAKIYYSTDGTEPTILYSDTVALSNLADVQAISKRFGSYTVDTARYEVTYVYDGVTARTASGGLLKNAFEWCGTDKIEMLDIDGQLNDEDFATIRGLSKLTVLNMAASKIENSSIPSEAFANMSLEWFVSPYNFTSVGSGIFKGCDKLAALTWNSSSIELPEDVVTDVANPNMLVYAKAQSMIPYAMKNVIVNGVANNIVLVDSAGNNNFRCPEEFLARRITYTHNYQQETKQGQTQGWETLALPFTVSKITHETKGEITPFAVEGAERPFWLYELGGNGMEKATEIRANTPYLICMPNDDAYGDEYMLGGRVTFSATNVTITTSGGTTVSRGDRQFVPTYQRVASSSDVYALNVNEVVGDNPVGSVFVQSLREVRPFEAYSVHSTNRARIITVSSLGGGDATGINDLIQNNAAESADGVVKVYSLSGALIKQGKREEVLRSLPNGLYIINGKKIIK